MDNRVSRNWMNLSLDYDYVKMRSCSFRSCIPPLQDSLSCGRYIVEISKSPQSRHDCIAQSLRLDGSHKVYSITTSWFFRIITWLHPAPVPKRNILSFNITIILFPTTERRQRKYSITLYGCFRQFIKKSLLLALRKL